MQHGLFYIETSAVAFTNIYEIFYILIQTMIDRKNEETSTMEKTPTQIVYQSQRNSLLKTDGPSNVYASMITAREATQPLTTGNIQLNMETSGNNETEEADSRKKKRKLWKC